MIIDALAARQLQIPPGLPGIGLTWLGFDPDAGVVALVHDWYVAGYVMEFPVDGTDAAGLAEPGDA